METLHGVKVTSYLWAGSSARRATRRTGQMPSSNESSLGAPGYLQEMEPIIREYFARIGTYTNDSGLDLLLGIPGEMDKLSPLRKTYYTRLNITKKRNRLFAVANI